MNNASLLLLALLPLGLSSPATATNRSVYSLGDGLAPGSLRLALQNSVAGDTIEIEITGTLVTSSTIDVNKAVTINGPIGGGFTIQRSTAQGTANFPVITVSASGNFTLRRLTLTNGYSPSGGGGLRRITGGTNLIEDCQFISNRSGEQGGGLWCSGDGSFTLRRCTIQGNSSSATGGGLYIRGTSLDARQCSFIGNSTPVSGAGLDVATDSSATLIHCTFSGNAGGATRGSAISISNGTKVLLLGSTITGNGSGTSVNQWAVLNGSSSTRVGSCILSGNKSYDWAGSATSLGYNLIGKAEGALFRATADLSGVTDPKLEPLGLYGGTLLVHPPRYDSSDVIDRGSNLSSLAGTKETSDQLGNPRSVKAAWQDLKYQGDRSDIGAVELQEKAQSSTGDIVVNNTGDWDDGVAGEFDCTLREALRVANARPAEAPAIIRFHPRAFPSTGPARSIELLSELPGIKRPMSIYGPGAKFLTVRRSPSAGNKFSILSIGENHVVADISGLSLADGDGALGGGIYIFSTGTLNLSDCHVTGCHASQGGGGLFCKDGTVTIRNCSFWNNRSDAQAAACLFGTGTATITNSTFQGNRAVNGPGTILTAGSMGLASCTIVDNYPSGIGGTSMAGITARNCIITRNYKDDVDGRVRSSGFNLVRFANSTFVPGTSGDQTQVEDPGLGPLKDNGGPTYTMALLPGSRAIDKGGSPGALTTDQRGLPRSYDFPGYYGMPGSGFTDIGAFELQPVDFETWRRSVFAENQLSGAESSATGDANASGVPNGIKHLLGLQAIAPLTAQDRQALPKFARSLEGGRNYVTFSYRRSSLYSGPAEVVQISTNLKQWTTAVSVVTTTSGIDPATLTQTVTLKVDVTDMPRAYLRLAQ